VTSIIYRYEIDGEIRYVGSAYNFKYKIRQIAHLKKHKDKHGTAPERIVFFVIEECDDLIRFEREGFWIDKYKAEGHALLNIKDPRKMFPENTMRGGHPSEETLKKMSKSRKGIPKTQPVSDETRQRLSDVGMGHVVSEETKQKLRVKSTGQVSTLKGKPSPLKGKTLSPETRQRMSDAAKIRSSSPEYRQKLSDGVQAYLKRKSNGVK